ncbi:hypothetical protein PR202_ga17101 [Eleusine coracana subsp. coracana]|uniref:Uncharacterized protein n=1 Tax=Eleusine coracana subsp. coracana TaxID=191504 RepID=A0AAV5CPF1_ELECO|nr:hypothetical protein PR202_ga17101 [Eleusine coracana subsp. coracana]
MGVHLVDCTSLKQMINKAMLLETAYKRVEKERESKRKSATQVNRPGGPQRPRFSGPPVSESQFGRSSQGQGYSSAPHSYT